jgi:hypothetical protein
VRTTEEQESNVQSIEALIAKTEPNSSGWAETTAEIELAFLPSAPLRAIFEPAHVTHTDVVRVLTALASLPESLKEEVTRSIFAFYEKEIADGACNFDTPQAQLDWEAEHNSGFVDPVPASTPAEIWPLVQFTRVHVCRNVAKTAVIARVEGNAAWDGEHGIVLHFREGERLTAVSGYGEAVFSVEFE